MSERYRLSFTTGGLFLREATTVVERYLSIRDWKAARDQVRQENLLQVRTAAAATRISKEVTARLELLDDAELEALQDGGLREQAYLLWVAACRRYSFIREFATEVVREHHLTTPQDLGLAYRKTKVAPCCTSYASPDSVTPYAAPPAFKEPHHETHS